MTPLDINYINDTKNITQLLVSLAKKFLVQPVLEPWREVGYLRDCVVEKGIPFFGLCGLRGKELVDWNGRGN
jgi:hypothetical protein